jgi:hypothetical protein
MVTWLLRALFRRKRHDHWSQERDEHLAEAARRRVAAEVKFSAVDAPATDPMLDSGSTVGGR